MTPSPFHGIFSSLGTVSTVKPQLKGKVSSSQKVKAEPIEIDKTEVPLTSPMTQSGQIAVDIYELANYYVIRAPIAGVKLADLDIEVDGRVITISGRREQTEEAATDSYLVQECFWGEFSRNITLPIHIDPKKIRATFSKDSILKILVPKTEEKVKIVRISESG